MKNHLNVIKSTSLVALLILGLSCSKKAEETGTTTDTGGGGTVLFTAADIQKSWSSGCLAGSDPISGGDHYIISMTLFGGTSNNFSHSTVWYSGACGGGSNLLQYSLSGTYSVGAAITGGQAITFTSTSSDIAAYGATVKGYVNTSCGGTSPFFGGAHAGSNSSYSSYTMACSNITMPNSGNTAISNVATYSSSTLTLGTPYPNIPGVFPGASVPTTATVQLF